MNLGLLILSKVCVVRIGVVGYSTILVKTSKGIGNIPISSEYFDNILEETNANKRNI